MSRQRENTSNLRTSWQRIERWLAQHAPAQAKSLAKGASPAQIQKLEAQLGVTLPTEYKESCAIHDGQTADCDLIPDGFGTFYLLRLKDIPQEWSLWDNLSQSGEFQGRSAKGDNGVASSWWKSGWIPFASNGGGDHLCLDLAPKAGGAVGQVIKIHHDHGDRNLLAPSFAAWLRKLADSLESGALNDFLE